MTAPSDVNDQKVLEVLAGAETMRRVQIADKLDATTDDVQAILAGLLAVGDIVETDGFAPNGIECKLYALSPAFRRSAACKPMEAKAAAANFPSVPGATRAERAIAFISARGENGSATTSELHALLGLASDEYVSAMLSSSVRAGRLVKTGKDWTLGPALQPGAEPAPRLAPQPSERAIAAAAAWDVSKKKAPAEAQLPPVQDRSQPDPVVLAYPSSKGGEALAAHTHIGAAALITSGLALDAAPRDNTGTGQVSIGQFAITPRPPGSENEPPSPDHRPRLLSSQVDPSSALQSAPAGDRPAEHPPLSVMLGETAPPDVDDDLTPFSSDLNLDPVPVRTPLPSEMIKRFFSDAPLPTLDITMRTDLRDPRAADRREQAAAVVAVAPLRFGVWSDGFVELQRAGTTVATLTRADADALADHMLALRQGGAA